MCHLFIFCINVTNAFFNVQVNPRCPLFLLFFVNMVVVTLHQPFTQDLEKLFQWERKPPGSFLFLKAGWFFFFYCVAHPQWWDVL